VGAAVLALALIAVAILYFRLRRKNTEIAELREMEHHMQMPEQLGPQDVQYFGSWDAKAYDFKQSSPSNAISYSSPYTPPPQELPEGFLRTELPSAFPVHELPASFPENSQAKQSSSESKTSTN
jgi:hypothetical protein